MDKNQNNCAETCQKPLRILHLEDSFRDAETIRERLIDAGFSIQVDRAANEKTFTSFLESGGYDLIFLDYHLPGFSGTAGLKLARALSPEVPAIYISGIVGEEKAVDILKEGATDYVLKDKLGKLPLAVTRALDEVKERKAHRLVTEAIHESEKRYRSLFENMLNGCAFCQILYEDGKAQDCIFQAVNSAFTSQTGLKDVVGRKVSEVFPGIWNADPQPMEIFSRVAASGRPERFETCIQSLQMWFDITVYSPEPGCFVTVFDVITERKQQEEEIRKLYADLERKIVEHTTELRVSEEKYRSLVEGISDCIWETDADARFTYLSSAFLDITGYPPEEFLGKTPLDIVPSDGVSRIDEMISASIASRQPLSMLELPICHRNGYEVVIEVRSVPVFSSEGLFQGVRGITRDITRSKQAERTLRDSEELFRTLFESAGVRSDRKRRPGGSG